MGTTGDISGTNGPDRNGRAPAAAAAVVAAILFVQAGVDAVSLVDGEGDMPASRAFALEFTSTAFFALLIWPLWQVSRQWRPPQLRWPLALAAHLALSVPVLLAHVLWLSGSRTLVFAAMGLAYRFPWSWPQLIFEWRKDVLALFALAGIGWLLDRLSTVPPPEITPVPYRLAVKDGPRTTLLAADEISHASSAGNYVELFTRHGRLLHRVTLAALADELGPHGFVRIHRTHLVRLAAVSAVERSGSGDFAITLQDGTQLPGSRRWREGLARLVL